MTVGDVCNFLAGTAPPALQESYDNSGLLVGELQSECTGIIVSLDCLEAVVEEAIEKNCNLVVSHHPIVFGGLKRFNKANYIERVVMKAIKHDVALYAIHTNLDNVSHGVNKRIADRIGLKNTQILQPKKDQLLKLQVYVPQTHADQVREALHGAGAGHIGDYSQCSFNSVGEGKFMAKAGTTPHVGKQGELHTESEVKIEVVLPAFAQSNVVRAMRKAHPYEEVAYDLLATKNSFSTVGAGMVGDLEEAISLQEFLDRLRRQLKTGCIRYTADLGTPIKRIAVCGGSGSFLLNAAKRSGADVFVTADYKYHQFFDADGDLVIADIGHYESEQFTIDLLVEMLTDKFPKFAVHFTGVNTNPVNYF